MDRQVARKNKWGTVESTMTVRVPISAIAEVQQFLADLMAARVKSGGQ